MAATKKKERKQEEHRLRDLFEYVRGKIGDPRLKDVELETIRPKQTDENYFLNEMFGRIRLELFPKRKVLLLNMTRTKKMSDMGVVGLLAHEFAHLCDETIKNPYLNPPKTVEESRRLNEQYDNQEKAADIQAGNWGLGDELKVSIAETTGFSKSGLTTPEYLELIKSWKPQDFALLNHEGGKGPKKGR